MKTLRRPRIRARTRGRGFVLVTAIFLVVIMAALGGFMLNFSANTNIASAQDVQGTRVYWVARSGLQWAVSNILYAGNCNTPPTSLEGFTLTIACTTDTHDENGTIRTIWRISSKANSASGTPGSIGYTERLLSATVEK